MKQVDINETIGTFSFSVQSETSQQVVVQTFIQDQSTSETIWHI